MDRRTVLAAGSAFAAAAFVNIPAFVAAAGIRTKWKLRLSEGFDALCFLGPLAGDEFYTQFYKKDLAAFLPALAPEAVDKIKAIFARAQSAGMLLGPELCLIFSGGKTDTVDDLIAAIDSADTALRPPFEHSAYWDSDTWNAFDGLRPVVRSILKDMQSAGFSAFREARVAPLAAKRIPELTAKLATLDVIAEDERLRGPRYDDPAIEIDLLYFSMPHGIRVQGQRFLTHLAYPDEIVIRNACHELLHPPFDAHGEHMKFVLGVLSRDALLTRIVAEHDKRFGYNDFEGYVNEDTVQALEQIASERLGFANPPVERWSADDGMHVLAAGLFGLLKADGYDKTGGNIEEWLYVAAKDGKLTPESLHAAAAHVLGRPVDKLWPVKAG